MELSKPLRRLAGAVVLLLSLGCSDTIGPSVGLAFSFTSMIQDEGAGVVRGNGTIFPESFELPLGELPGIEAFDGPLSFRVRGVFFAPCDPGPLNSAVDLDTGAKRAVLVVWHEAEANCAGDPTPWAFSAVLTQVPGGEYDLEVVYEDTALVLGVEFSERISVFTGTVTSLGPS